MNLSKISTPQQQKTGDAAKESRQHTQPPIRESSTPTLQRLAGNRAVNQLLQQPSPLSPHAGHPLTDEQSQWLERSAGPLPPIMLHEGAGGQQLTTAANAHAATWDSQIAIESSTQTGQAGKTLLAHEVAHVLQQRAHHLPRGTTEQIENDADLFAHAVMSGVPADVQFSAPLAWAYQNKSIRKGDRVASMLVANDQTKRVIVTMQSGDIFVYTWTQNTIPPRPEAPYTAFFTAEGIKVPVEQEGTVLFFEGLPDPGQLVFPETFPLTVIQSLDEAEEADTSATKEGQEATVQGTLPSEESSVPIITVSDLQQVEDLKRRGLIPVEQVDQIKGKLEKKEPLNFEETLALLDALNRVIPSPQPGQEQEAKQTQESWVEWSKFIQENKDKISGAAKTGAKGMTTQDVKAIIAAYKEFVGVKEGTAVQPEAQIFDPATRKSWNELPQWQRTLWGDYQKTYGGASVSERTDVHMTELDLLRMGFVISFDYMGEGAHEAAVQLFSDPKFWDYTFGGIIAYLALWGLPEPAFSKSAAVLTTIALLSIAQFTVTELKNVALAFLALKEESAKATTLKQLEEAGEHFGNKIGGVGLRLLVLIASILLGKVLPGPRPAGGGGMQRSSFATEGGSIFEGAPANIAGEATTIKVLADGTVVISGPVSGMVAMATKAGASSGGEEKAPEKKPAEEKAPEKKPYVNNNPKATVDERRVGEWLHNKAQAGELPGVTEVEGAPEIPGKGRSGDYRFTRSDGQKISADLYQPESGNPESISTNIRTGKSGQAEVVVVELGRGKSATITNEQALKLAKDVVKTPGVSVSRVIVIKNEMIIVDEPQ